MRFGLISAAALCCLAIAAKANPFDTTMLFAHKHWSVEHTYDSTDGSSWCSADTANGANQWFSVTGFDNGGIALFVGDPRWSLSSRQVRYRIDVDYSRWDIDGTADRSAVSVFLNGSDKAGKFLGELMGGSAVAVYSEDGRRLATFSLQGSHAAMNAFAECWARIHRGSDPFTNASDPF